MDIYIHPSELAVSTTPPLRRGRTALAASVVLTVLMTGCGGGVSGAEGVSQNVPSAAQIADAQAALDGTVPTDDSIAAKQLALDTDADKDPE